MGRRSSAPKKNDIPEEVVFQTKPQIALDLIDRAKANGIAVMAWTADELSGRDGWSLRRILRVACGRWPVEDCFREAKEELGLDHFECRGWRCIHRHRYVTILSQLFCARVRQQLSPNEDVLSGELVTMEQVRRAANGFIGSIGLPPRCRQQRYQDEADRQSYHARRNAQAAKSHRKTRRKRLAELGIDPEQIKSVYPKPPPC